ncbi:hypothetical protein V7111_19705 [Neobacillus niacini]|uniref:hypothetical protein n=1 Tax=Neobacillus niacini TaxID=86668 RepID=UPI0030033DAB
MRENVRVKSVHFNIKTDEELLKSLGRRNFSKYVKELIKADVQRKKELPKQSIKQSGGIKFTLE